MKNYYLLIGLFLISNLSYGQLSKKNYELGLVYLEVQEYDLAIKQLIKSWERRQETETVKKIVFAYSMLRNHKEAALWQKKIIDQLYKGEDKAFMFDILFSAEEYKLVSKCLNKFYLDSNRTWYRDIKQRMDTLNQWKFDLKGRIKEVTSVNTVSSEISPVFTKEGLFFSSNRELNHIKRKDNATGLPHYDFFKAEGSKADLIGVKRFSTIINSKSDESSGCFSSDMQDVYFTRLEMGSKAKNEGNKMKLYRSKKESDIWLKPEVFVLNDSSSAFGQPFLTSDGQLFFFASDMPGGYGGSDLYVSKRIDGTHWTPPVNLGEHVNSSGNEMNPFFDGDKKIYFSSDGYFSLGGYDLYVSELKGSDWTDPNNLKYPINSPADDFSVFWFNEKEAYVSSNRVNGTGLEDIYYYKTK